LSWIRTPAPLSGAANTAYIAQVLQHLTQQASRKRKRPAPAMQTQVKRPKPSAPSTPSTSSAGTAVTTSQQQQIGIAISHVPTNTSMLNTPLMAVSTPMASSRSMTMHHRQMGRIYQQQMAGRMHQQGMVGHMQGVAIAHPSAAAHYPIPHAHKVVYTQPSYAPMPQNNGTISMVPLSHTQLPRMNISAIHPQLYSTPTQYMQHLRHPDQARPRQSHIWPTKAHDLFVAAMQRHGRDWEAVTQALEGTHTLAQVRTHAKKYFHRLRKLGLHHLIPPLSFSRRPSSSSNSTRSSSSTNSSLPSPPAKSQ